MSPHDSLEAAFREGWTQGIEAMRAAAVEELKLQSCRCGKRIRALPGPAIPTREEKHDAEEAPEDRQEEEPREPSSWRCRGCGVTFSRDPRSDGHAVHDPLCDGSCRIGCPVQCGPIEEEP